MLTVMTWLWAQPNGRTQYTAVHVNIWASMVRRNLTIPHRLACVTRMPEGIDADIEIITPPGDFENVRIGTWGEHLPQCLRRLSMFRPDAADIFGERFVSMDLDCLPCGNLDDLFEEDVDFRMCRGTSQSRPYNGSLLMMRAGSRPQVFTQFTPEGAAVAGRRFVGSDQAWISHCLGFGERVWDKGDGVLFWPRAQHAPEHERRLIFFAGKTKPWDLVGRDPWIAEHYRFQLRRGRCLILGYSDAVWTEAEAALSCETFEVVIASPEAASAWPGKVDAIAKDDDEAETLARMIGFDDWAFCGRTKFATDRRAKAA